MGIDRSALKRQAREEMRLPRPSFWLVTLVYLLMTTWLSTLLDLAVPAQGDPSTFGGLFSLFLSILLTLYTVVVSFGYTLWSLWTARRLNPGLGSLIEGFSVAGRVIWMEILILSRVVGWALLFSVLLIFVSLLFSSLPIVELLVLFLAAAAIWIFLLRYSLASYLLADRPDDGASAAIRRSVELMDGWKWEMFKLEFSFLGWYLLQLLLSGLPLVLGLYQAGFFPMLLSGTPQELYLTYVLTAGSLPVLLASQLLTLPLQLWFTPYLSVTRARFYEFRLQAQQASAPPLPPL